MKPIQWNELLLYNLMYNVGKKFPREDYVSNKYLMISDEHKNTFINKVKFILNVETHVVLENGFPYYLNNNIKHYVYWTMNDDIYTAYNNLIKLFKTNNIVVFQNTMMNKSIQDIEHYQVFVYTE